MARRLVLVMLAGCVVLAGCQTKPSSKVGKWQSLFDGKSLDGWKVTEESPDTFRVEKGEIVANGNRAHLFYDGPVGEHNFKNYEFKADVMTWPNSNSGMYIDTKYQKEGWPSAGYEIQVNNSYEKDPRKTASIYGKQDIKEKLANDKEWFTQHIIVKGKTVTVKINGKVVNEWTEPEDQNKLVGGTVALQGHDPGSEVHYKNIKVKILP